MIVSDSECLSV